MQKEDVLAYMAGQRKVGNGRRLAQEQGGDIRAVTGKGSKSAVLAACLGSSNFTDKRE